MRYFIVCRLQLELIYQILKGPGVLGQIYAGSRALLGCGRCGLHNRRYLFNAGTYLSDKSKA